MTDLIQQDGVLTSLKIGSKKRFLTHESRIAPRTLFSLELHFIVILFFNLNNVTMSYFGLSLTQILVIAYQVFRHPQTET
jgi:hypothetical protein